MTLQLADSEQVLEVPPVQRPYVMPGPSCEDECRGLPTTAYLACTAACEQGVHVREGARLAPPGSPSNPWPDIPNPLPAVVGLGKWVVVGLVALVALNALRIVK